MRDEFIAPAATIAAAIIAKGENAHTPEQIADLFRRAYEGLEKAQADIANRTKSHWESDPTP